MWTKKEKNKPSGQTTLTRVAPVVIERALKGLEFPAAKEEILRTAEKNNVPDDVFFTLDQIEDRNYSALEDIILELA
jgi:hypothetical protein